MKRIPLGFIGGGLNSAVGQAHYSALHMDGLFKLVAGRFSRVPQINQATAQHYNVPCVETESELLDYLLEKDGALVVLTPTPQHYETVFRALSLGVRVICEKALCTSPQEARKLQQLRAGKEGWLATVYNYTGYPMINELRYMISTGQLGEICSIRAEMPQEGYLRHRPQTIQPWRLEDGSIPTVYLDLGVHLHQLVYYLTGEVPIELVAQEACKGNMGVIDQVDCLAFYSNGAHVNFWFGKSMLGQRNGLRIQVYGTQGSAEWYQGNPEELHVAYANGEKVTRDRSCAIVPDRKQRFKPGHPAGYIEALANLYADFHTGLEIGAVPPEYTANVAYEGLQMVLAMTKSARSQLWIPLENTFA